MNRQPAVAGQFYAADDRQLRQQVSDLLGAAGSANVARPKALLVPHAGYIYSGPTAAQAFAQLGPWARQTRRVVMLGPAHRVPVAAMATSSAASFVSPLGEVPLDRALIEELIADGLLEHNDHAHAPEHCLEVELPFLQQCLDRFELLPVLVGGAGPAQVEALLERVWGDDGTLILISSDLSHFHSYEAASRIDRATAEAIEALDWASLGPRQACGHRPLQGLLRCIARRHMSVERLHLCNSGDTAGDRDRVVGYASYAFR